MALFLNLVCFDEETTAKKEEEKRSKTNVILFTSFRDIYIYIYIYTIQITVTMIYDGTIAVVTVSVETVTAFWEILRHVLVSTLT